MVFNSTSFSALLHALKLTQGLHKPSPGSILPFALAKSVDAHFTGHRGPSGQGPLEYSQIHLPLAHIPRDECFVKPYIAPPIEKQAFLPFDPHAANIYRYRQQQSVNLGSWFVHENWMSPSLFTCADGKKLSELDIASGWGSKDSARSLLERHWDTWITLADFEYLAKIGINTVRLPIGYWSLGPLYCQGTPFEPVADVYRNSWSRVVRAINTAAEVGIGVLVDLHGAPGSQNGQPHSGISDGAANMLEDPWNVDKTMAVLGFLMEQLSSVTNVVGIQILNEPTNHPDLINFYARAIDFMRRASPTGAAFPLYMHDGFDLGRLSNFVSQRTDFVVQDHHSYFVFTPSDEAEAASQHTSDVRGPIFEAFTAASDKERRNIVIDEWSCALTPESIANEPNQDQSCSDFCRGQMDMYSRATAGWSFWSYLKEQCNDDPGWCFKAAVNNSLPATFFSYNRMPSMGPHRMELVHAAIANMSIPSVSDILSPPRSGDSNAAHRSVRRSFYWRWGLDSSPRRFDVIHQRRQEKQNVKDDPQLTPAQKSTVKGYTDGFLAAKIFAGYALSKVGFIGQYVEDSIKLSGSALVAFGTEQNYRDGFGQGMMTGQGLVVAALG